MTEGARYTDKDAIALWVEFYLCIDTEACLAAMRRAVITIAELERARAVDWRSLHEPMTI